MNVHYILVWFLLSKLTIINVVQNSIKSLFRIFCFLQIPGNGKQLSSEVFHVHIQVHRREKTRAWGNIIKVFTQIILISIAVSIGVFLAIPDSFLYRGTYYSKFSCFSFYSDDIIVIQKRST